MDTGKFRTFLENTVVCFGLNTQEDREHYIALCQLGLTDTELPWELKGTPAEKYWSDAITLIESEDATAAPKIRDLLEKILRYMAAVGIG
jgi:hypothetical protein